MNLCTLFGYFRGIIGRIFFIADADALKSVPTDRNCYHSDKSIWYYCLIKWSKGEKELL